MFPEHLFFKTARITLLRFKSKYFLLLLATASLLGSGESSRAEVTLDGTMGPSGALAGPDVVIPDTVGQTQGSNLFHSFSVFNINTGESATFTGPAVIDNVLSRVTGGSQSLIDGRLRSTIESANLWFINPAGVLFGEHASLDVDGSFHVSTADYLRLADGGRFEATHPENSVLTTAPPEAFGFLGERQPAGIAMQGSALEVPSGETLSTVGGDIQIVGGNLTAPGGRINMASVASAGEVVLRDADLGVESFERLGKIDISQNGLVSTSGEGGGAIFIRGGEFVMDNSLIQADTLGDKDGTGVDVTADSLSLTGGAQISASTSGAGKGGNLSAQANTVFLAGTDVSGFPSGLFAQASSTGNAGHLMVNANSLEVQNGALIDTSTFSSGNAGNIEINANSLEVLGGAQININAGTFSSGNGGNIEINANRANLVGDFNILIYSGSGLQSTGRGGNLQITADDLILKGASLSVR